MHTTAWSRWLAIAAGCLASCGALFILLKDDVVSGRWSNAFVLVPIMVGIAIAAGHLAACALRDRKILSAIGFSIAFVLGTGLTILTSVGKQAATSDATVSATEAHNKRLTDLQDDLRRARNRHEQALSQADREITTGGCKARCQDWKLRAAEVSAHITKLETDIEGWGPQQPVTAKADRVAQLATLLFGVSQARTKTVLVLVEPFCYALLFELTSIAAFGYAFGRRQRVVPVARATQPLPISAVKALAPKTVHAAISRDEALADLRHLIASGVVIQSQDFLVQRWKVTKGECSKRLSDWEARGLIKRSVDGRCKMITAA